jgi:retron-type reverse transcriptase
MAETEASAASLRIEDWTQTPWRTLERHVFRLQKRIYRAQARGNTKAVHSLQRLLMKSRAARTLAVRRVTQDNHGKKTAGVERYIKVRDAASPYDGNLNYWSRRLRTHWATDSPMARLLQRQHGRCAICGLTFRDDDRLMRVTE